MRQNGLFRILALDDQNHYTFVKSLDKNHKIRLQQKFCFTFVLNLLWWQYLPNSGLYNFLVNSFTEKSGKSGKSVNIAAEMRQNGLFRILALDDQNHYTFVKSLDKNHKIRLQQKFCFTFVLNLLWWQYLPNSGWCNFLVNSFTKN